MTSSEQQETIDCSIACTWLQAIDTLRDSREREIADLPITASDDSLLLQPAPEGPAVLQSIQTRYSGLNLVSSIGGSCTKGCEIERFFETNHDVGVLLKQVSNRLKGH